MNEKISINIDVPGMDAEHNFLAPAKMNISRMILLITEMLVEEYGDMNYDKSRTHLLLKADTGEVLLSEANLNQLGIVNGDRLLFI
jgi:hypothetical protein